MKDSATETIKANDRLDNKWNISKNIERMRMIGAKKYFATQFVSSSQFIRNGRHKKFNLETHTSRLIPCLSLHCYIKLYEI